MRFERLSDVGKDPLADEGSRGIVEPESSIFFVHVGQDSMPRGLPPFFSSRDEFGHFLPGISFAYLPRLFDPIGMHDDSYLVNNGCSLEGIDRVLENRTSVFKRKELLRGIPSYSAARSAG